MKKRITILRKNMQLILFFVLAFSVPVIAVNEIIIEALIDDVSEIWLTSEGIYWKHNTGYAKPGLHDGRNEPTFVNGKKWFPIWSMPDSERGIDTSKLYPLSIGTLNFNAELLAVGEARNAKGIERGSIRLRREKNAVVVTADDRLPLAGSRWYRIRLYRSDDLRDITFTKQPYKQTVKEITVSAIEKLSFVGDDIIQVKANAEEGFNFPFYLFVPKTIDKNQEVYLLVESNNTGKTSDDLEVHQESALRLVSKNHPNRIARSLRSPLLVPVFPRPATDWQAYTHALDRDTLEIEEGELKRIDLQLTAMIKYAQQLLRINGFKIYDRIFMHGFSASAKFCNRYSFLHPEMVKAIAAGGVNGLPTLPVSEWNKCELPFPIGIAGIERFTGKLFNEKAFRRVAHYIYMGSFDRNDTLPSRDAWSEEEADIIKKALAEKMMPDRWELSQKIYKDQDISAQLVTYNGVSHSIKDEMLDDVIKFFRANLGEKYTSIEPHQYPFVEYKQIRQAHINGLYWSDDERLPERDRRNPYERTFLIGIEEWNEGQDHRQLGEFKTNAGFKFVLKAEGQKDIEINENNYSGTRSWGNGEFQAFYVKLNESQFGQIVPSVSYRLEPLNDSNEYFWTVNDGVTLTKSDSRLTLDVLNSIMVPSTTFIDSDIRAVIGVLENVTSHTDLPDEMEKIEFVLLVESEELRQLPKVKFSVEGLSIIEVLWIACNRACLEYRIRGNTVYINKKK